MRTAAQTKDFVTTRLGIERSRQNGESDVACGVFKPAGLRSRIKATQLFPRRTAEGDRAVDRGASLRGRPFVGYAARTLR